MITGWTNSTATWRACSVQAGATHHIVAPAAKRRASARAAVARSSPGSPVRRACPAVDALARLPLDIPPPPGRSVDGRQLGCPSSGRVVSYAPARGGAADGGGPGPGSWQGRGHERASLRASESALRRLGSLVHHCSLEGVTPSEGAPVSGPSPAEGDSDTTRLAICEAFVEASHDALFSLDAGERIVRWNLGAERVFGHRRRRRRRTPADRAVPGPCPTCRRDAARGPARRRPHRSHGDRDRAPRRDARADLALPSGGARRVRHADRVRRRRP